MIPVLLLSATLLGQTQPVPPPPAAPEASVTRPAEEWRIPITATLGFANQYATHRSYDLVDENDVMPQVRIAAGYALRAGPALLDLELGFQSGGSSASLHDVREASLWLRGLDLGATYRYPLLPFLHPWARLGVGYDWATLEIGNALQRVGHPSVNAMAGLAIPVVRIDRDGAKHPLFVAEFGVGYTLRPAFEFDALRPEELGQPDPDAVPVAPLKLGRLELSGITWKLGLSFRL